MLSCITISVALQVVAPLLDHTIYQERECRNGHLTPENPVQFGEGQVRTFLEGLAVERCVSASTQNQALSGIYLFSNTFCFCPRKLGRYSP
jgi:Phage integrase, N-terminal SAM-like domain